MLVGFYFILSGINKKIIFKMEFFHFSILEIYHFLFRHRIEIVIMFPFFI
jgi:hypothetical protein